MKKIFVVIIAVVLSSCASKESKEFKLIDDQAALVRIVVATPEDFATTESNIEKLRALATSFNGKDYVEKKIVELRQQIEHKAVPLINDFWNANFDKEAPIIAVKEAITNEYKRQNKEVTFLSSNYIDAETKFSERDRKRTTDYNFLVTIRENTGIFQSDKFYSVKALCSANYVMGDGGIHYNGKINSITQTR
ncbi:MAG: hypothetical protein HYZ54_10820 [Ignavibacteriae bacterium]|nr:hypothetical protein [Ignavibacteriota bacterium]